MFNDLKLQLDTSKTIFENCLKELMFCANQLLLEFKCLDNVKINVFVLDDRLPLSKQVISACARCYDNLAIKRLICIVKT